MAMEAHHARALLETAQLELDRVHRAAIAANAGEIRRGLALALTALHDAGSAGLGETADQTIATVLASLEAARSDLDGGALAEMEKLVETARSSLAQI
jgi:tRNA(Ile)-lysidine synthase TilS/MesJ